jgi:hypothetical protein
LTRKDFTARRSYLSLPASAAKDVGAGIFGHFTKKDMEACKIGQYALSDPDGVLLDFSEN